MFWFRFCSVGLLFSVCLSHGGNQNVPTDQISDCSLYDEDDYDLHHSRLPVIINCVSSSGVLGEKYEEALTNLLCIIISLFSVIAPSLPIMTRLSI